MSWEGININWRQRWIRDKIAIIGERRFIDEVIWTEAEQLFDYAWYFIYNGNC